MERRSAVEGPDLLPARLVFELLPPGLDTADNAVAVLDNLRTRCASSVGGRHIGVIDAVFDIVDSGFEKCLADPKNVVAHKPDRPVAIIDDAFDQPPIGNLPDITLRRAQYVDPFRQKDRWRKRRMPCALDADELGNVFEVLTKNVLPRTGEHRHRSYPKLQKLLPPGGIVEDVDSGKGNLFFRKKLFRSKAAASARLRE